jgi:two-component system, OmpR family, copper resistance phosphate regulon response regulator CusR
LNLLVESVNWGLLCGFEFAGSSRRQRTVVGGLILKHLGGEIKPVRILVVEDEAKLAEALKMGLEGDLHSVTLAHTGEDGFFLAQTQVFDLWIFDVMLPGRDGIEILRNLRRLGDRTPGMLLTSRDAVEDRVRGLDSGADDYLVKPFAFSELQARIRALLRRGVAEIPATLRLGDLELDQVRHTVARAGKPIDLTPKEFELLEYLLSQPGQVVSRDMLGREVWKESSRHTPLDNVIDVHIARLRRKLDDGFERKILQTVRGVGFVLRLE